MATEHLEPKPPRDAGVPEPEPGTEDVEPVHLVENDVRGRLCGEGFTEEQILTWVESYFDSHAEGSADEVIEWIKRQERKTA